MGEVTKIADIAKIFMSGEAKRIALLSGVDPEISWTWLLQIKEPDYLHAYPYMNCFFADIDTEQLVPLEPGGKVWLTGILVAEATVDNAVWYAIDCEVMSFE